MAIYEYLCEDCKKTFTHTERISEHTGKRRPACPKCKRRNVHQLFSGFYAKTATKS